MDTDRPRYYVLDEHRHIKVTDDISEMGKFFENDDFRRVDQTQVGDYWVSTVFLCIDHNFSLEGPPILFETMVFKDDGECTDYPTQRYATYAEAHKGHWEIVDQIRVDLKIHG